MKYAMILVIGIGVAIGLFVPGGKRPAPQPASPTAAATPSASTPSATEVEDVPRETVLDRESSGHFFTFADVNGEPVRFVVDTGADIVALTQEDARRVNVVFDPAKFDVVGQGASGDVRGQPVVLRDVVLDGKRVDDVHAVVLDGLGVSLLGQNYLRHLDSVSISGDRMTLR